MQSIGPTLQLPPAWTSCLCLAVPLIAAVAAAFPQRAAWKLAENAKSMQQSIPRRASARPFRRDGGGGGD